MKPIFVEAGELFEMRGTERSMTIPPRRAARRCLR
jgi:hypothetical protein